MLHVTQEELLHSRIQSLGARTHTERRRRLTAGRGGIRTHSRLFNTADGEGEAARVHGTSGTGGTGFSKLQILAAAVSSYKPDSAASYARGHTISPRPGQPWAWRLCASYANGARRAQRPSSPGPAARLPRAHILCPTHYLLRSRGGSLSLSTFSCGADPGGKRPSRHVGAALAATRTRYPGGPPPPLLLPI